MKTTRWGIIGCGHVTEVKSGPGFQNARNSSLVAVMRRNPAMARDYAERHAVPRWYDDAARLIGDPEVDAIYVATPPASHEEYTRLAAQAGKPVYVEKPMARNFEECQRMIAACHEKNVRLFVAYYRRALPRFLKIKELIGNGAIGVVRFATVTLYCAPDPAEHDPQKLPWRVIPGIAGAGRFLDLGSHTLDILDFILGPIASVSGQAANQAGLYPAEDIVSGSFVFQSGVPATGMWCFTAFNTKWSDVNEIVGSQGKLRFSTFGNEPVQLHRVSGSEDFAIDNPLHIQQPLIQTIVDELNGIGRCPSDGDSAARTSWVMDEMLRKWRGQ